MTTFNELPVEVQNELLEKYAFVGVDNGFWYEHIIEHWKERLYNMGIYVDAIYFDVEDRTVELSGAEYTADKVMDTLIRCQNLTDDETYKMYRLWMELAETGLLTFDSYSRGNGSMQFYPSFSLLELNQNMWTDFGCVFVRKCHIHTLEKIFFTFMTDVCSQIMDDLTAESDYLTSREFIIETIEANL